MCYFYCTCDPNNASQTNLGRTPYREVKADKDGVCLDCGYYAISTRLRLDPETELRNYLMDDGIDKTNGGNRRWAKYGRKAEQEREG